ncbi:hypothetical protein AAG906_020765 [Vitis piasezkii]
MISVTKKKRELKSLVYVVLANYVLIPDIGSTEWVEQNLLNLGSKVVAYLNVDCAVQGPGFFAGATPQLDNLLIEVAKKVQDPDSESMTIYDNWMITNKVINIQRLSGVDSDFAPLLQHAGVPSVDLYYGRDFPVYHTAFDSYNWMTNHGDPLFQRHVAVAGVWGLLALRLADDPILPFNCVSYTEQLWNYRNLLRNLVKGNVSLHPITASIQELASAAEEAEGEAKERNSEFLILKKRTLNDRLMLAERGFLDADGLQGRKWFKHLVTFMGLIISGLSIFGECFMPCSFSLSFALSLYSSVSSSFEKV